MITLLFFSLVTFYLWKIWKISNSKKELKKQIENLQLELDHQKQNQDNDQPYDTLDEVDQRGHHCQRKPKMFGSKISNHAKPQCHLQEDPNESYNSQTNIQIGTITNYDDNSSYFYNYSIAEIN